MKETIISGLLELSEEALIVRDMEDRVGFWNPAAERMYGWTAHEAIGQNLQNLLEERLLSNDCEDGSLEKGEWVGELRHRRKDGNVVFVRSRMKLLRDDLGSPTSVLIVNTDNTRQKALEAALVHLQRMEAVNHLVGLIAHNLNNELALLSLNLIEQPEKVHETEQCSGALRRGVECAGVMGRLLSLAKGSDSERVAISVSSLLQQVADILRYALPESIEIKTLITEKLWHVTGNPTHLRQAIINVCMNARDAMPSGGVLTVDAANIAGTLNRIVIQVSDTGGGITTEMKDNHLFEPFLTTKERATGLGLFATERIVKDHDGSIEVTSSVGHGTRFRIYLPAAGSGIGDPDNRVAYVKSA